MLQAEKLSKEFLIIIRTSVSPGGRGCFYVRGLAGFWTPASVPTAGCLSARVCGPGVGVTLWVGVPSWEHEFCNLEFLNFLVPCFLIPNFLKFSRD